MQSTFSKPEAGAPASVSPETASTPELQAQENKPLTIEQVREEATRIAQSMVDKAERRISTKAEEKINALKTSQSVLGLTDEVVEQATQKIVIDDLTAQREAPASAPSTPQAVTATSDDPVIAEIMDTFAQEGIEITKADPEFPPIDAVLKNPKGNMVMLRKELFKGIEAKRQRVASSTEQAPARVLSGGQEQLGETAPASAHDAWNEAYKKK